MTSDPTVNLVRAAYEPVVRSQIESLAAWNRRFPRTPEDDRRRREREDAEQNRRLTLMQDHLSSGLDNPDLSLTLGSIDVQLCRCGKVLYGGARQHLLHVYDVIAADVEGAL